MNTDKLKVIGTSVTLNEKLRRAAARDLPFEIEFEILNGVDCQRRGIMSPESFDIYDQWFHSLDLLWTAGSIQPVEVAKIDRWNHIGLPAGSSPGAPGHMRSNKAHGFGTRPTDVLFIQDDMTLGSATTPLIAMLPTTYNADSFAYMADAAAGLGVEMPESWAWLLDESWHGKCTLSKDPASSTVELALAARSAGLVDIEDPGDLSIEDIDALFEILAARQRTGHFAKLWASSEDSIRLMSGPSCVLGSLWSPAYYAIRGMGRKLTYAAPREGYRGWQSGLSLSAALPAEKLEMAYAYLNWWLDGVPGAIMARQGYYMSVTEPVRANLSPAEWDYWYEGLPASDDLPGLSAPIVVRKGEQREGGSHKERVERVAVWSTIMPEHNYLVRRWREFLDIRN
ncbi:MAG: extracellular solute-binding protein [Rhizobiaceae bacterium]|nr:extracellular solute-binding protein [Rhizobiaceae bacterium]